MIKTQAVATGLMTKAQAVAFTQKINTAIDSIGAMLLEAQERGAWKALGYKTWQDYVDGEFTFSRQRAWQLMWQQKVINTTSEAAGVTSTQVYISEKDAREINAEMAANLVDEIRSGKEIAEAVKEAIDGKAKRKADKAVQQAANDAFRDENRAALPDSIKAVEDAKRSAMAAVKAALGQQGFTDDGEPVDQSDADRIAELEDYVRALEAQNAVLAARLKPLAEMEVQWKQGGFDKVIADQQEVIRVANERIERESSDKAAHKRTADMWKKRAIELGWSATLSIEVGA